MIQFIRVKAWFLQKNNLWSSCNNDLRNRYKFNEYSKLLISKETDKAVFCNEIGVNLWIPKSCIIEVIQEGTQEQIEALEREKEALNIELSKAKAQKDIDAVIDISTDIQQIERRILYYSK